MSKLLAGSQVSDCCPLDYYPIEKKTYPIETYYVIFHSIWTDRSGQTVQTQIRLLLQVQSDQDLHCLDFCLHHLEISHHGRNS